MQFSTETRWLLTSKEVDIIEHWFGNYKEKFLNNDSFPRQDYYLRTNSKNLGIKIREPKFDNKGKCFAKLELKSLLEDKGAYKFNNSNTGIINSWIKYSFDLDKETNPLKLIYDKLSMQLNNEWIILEKDRLLVKYDSTTKRIVSGKEIISNGAGIELTKFRLNNKIYFTLGIEAFSDNNNTNQYFIESIEFLFNNIEITELEYINSKSYPEILL